MSISNKHYAHRNVEKITGGGVKNMDKMMTQLFHTKQIKEAKRRMALQENKRISMCKIDKKTESKKILLTKQ